MGRRRRSELEVLTSVDARRRADGRRSLSSTEQVRALRWEAACDPVYGPADERDKQHQAGGETHCGQVRGSNQDVIIVEPRMGLYSVLNEMGGANAGDVAAKLAAQEIVAHVRIRSRTRRRSPLAVLADGSMPPRSPTSWTFSAWSTSASTAGAATAAGAELARRRGQRTSRWSPALPRAPSSGRIAAGELASAGAGRAARSGLRRHQGGGRAGAARSAVAGARISPSTTTSPTWATNVQTSGRQNIQRRSPRPSCRSAVGGGAVSGGALAGLCSPLQALNLEGPEDLAPGPRDRRRPQGRPRARAGPRRSSWRPRRRLNSSGGQAGGEPGHRAERGTRSGPRRP